MPKLNDYKRCECCRGKKTILSLGGMTKKCTACKGVGHVDAAKDVVSVTAEESAVIVKRVSAPKKRVVKRDIGKLDKRSKAYRDSVSVEKESVVVNDEPQNLELFDKTA